MESLFLLCALLGGTFVVCQFVLTLLGLSDSVPAVDGGHDFSGDGGGELHDGLHAEVEADGGADADHGQHHSSSWLFGVLSLRTLVAATTFFGLSGMMTNRAGFSAPEQLTVAFLSGGAALFGVHWLMTSFSQLGQNSTLRMANAVGKTGSVSLAIAGEEGKRGKVLVEVQGRLEEVAAIAVEPGDLPTGARVQIVGISQGNILEVRRAFGEEHSALAAR
jgi:membrane protein implicated in regulation of membrane protease activity